MFAYGVVSIMTAFHLSSAKLAAGIPPNWHSGRRLQQPTMLTD